MQIYKVAPYCHIEFKICHNLDKSFNRNINLIKEKFQKKKTQRKNKKETNILLELFLCPLRIL